MTPSNTYQLTPSAVSLFARHGWIAGGIFSGAAYLLTRNLLMVVLVVAAMTYAMVLTVAIVEDQDRLR
jgi:hypothetical protein